MRICCGDKVWERAQGVRKGSCRATCHSSKEAIASSNHPGLQSLLQVMHGPMKGQRLDQWSTRRIQK
eukprot:5201462-Amphidinium_carterae.1